MTRVKELCWLRYRALWSHLFPYIACGVALWVVFVSLFLNFELYQMILRGYSWLCTRSSFWWYLGVGGSYEMLGLNLIGSMQGKYPNDCTTPQDSEIKQKAPWTAPEALSSLLPLLQCPGGVIALILEVKGCWWWVDTLLEYISAGSLLAPGPWGFQPS